MVVPRYYGMIGASGRYLTVRWAAFDGILDQHLPLIAWLLESVQVKRDQIIEEETFDLAAKDIDLGAENVQGMTIATSGSGAWGSSSRPLLGGSV